MELQKKKETLWVIKKRDSESKFRLKSIEVGGEIEKICLGFDDGEQIVDFDMAPDEFKNFYSILKSFKDLLYSEGLDILNESSSQGKQDLSTQNDPNSSDLENINDRTLKELDSLRNIEENKPMEDQINIKSENHEKVNQTNSQFIEGTDKIERGNIITQEMLDSLDEIDPFDGEMKNEPEKISEIKMKSEKSEITNEDKLKKIDNEEIELDPTEWDPW